MCFLSFTRNQVDKKGAEFEKKKYIFCLMVRFEEVPMEAHLTDTSI